MVHATAPIVVLFIAWLLWSLVIVGWGAIIPMFRGDAISGWVTISSWDPSTMKFVMGSEFSIELVPPPRWTITVLWTFHGLFLSVTFWWIFEYWLGVVRSWRLRSRSVSIALTFILVLTIVNIVAYAAAP